MRWEVRRVYADLRTPRGGKTKMPGSSAIAVGKSPPLKAKGGVPDAVIYARGAAAIPVTGGAAF